jgi:hypothetical protein
MRAPPMPPAVEVDGKRAELDYPAGGKCNAIEAGEASHWRMSVCGGGRPVVR